MQLAEHNYQRSLDHRSFYFRQSDKKNTGTRALISELLHKAIQLPPGVKKSIIPTSAPSNIPKVFNPPPHLEFTYPPDIAFAHRDAFRLIMFAVEKSQLSPSDKERAGRMYRDFLGPLFGLCGSWLYGSVKNSTVPPSAAMAIPPGALVTTAYGEGVVEDFTGGFYKIKVRSGEERSDEALRIPRAEERSDVQRRHGHLLLRSSPLTPF